MGFKWLTPCGTFPTTWNMQCTWCTRSRTFCGGLRTMGLECVCVGGGGVAGGAVPRLTIIILQTVYTSYHIRMQLGRRSEQGI